MRRADVGHAVALGVRPARLRVPREVHPERVRRGQAGPLAHEHDHGARAEPVPDVVAQRHPRLRGQDHRGDLPAVEPLEQRPHRGGGVAVDRERRQPVGHHHGQVGADVRQLGALGQAAAQVRALQVGGPVRGRRADLEHLEPGEALPDEGRVEGGVDGVLGRGVRGPELQLARGGQRVAGPAEGDPGPGRLPQHLPRVGRRGGRRLQGAHAPAEASRARAPGASAGRLSTWPASSMSPVRTSHASNSGAGRRPSTCRAVSTSWKLSDW